jgi:hypothetical protein
MTAKVMYVSLLQTSKLIQALVASFITIMSYPLYSPPFRSSINIGGSNTVCLTAIPLVGLGAIENSNEDTVKTQWQYAYTRIAIVMYYLSLLCDACMMHSMQKQNGVLTA